MVSRIIPFLLSGVLLLPSSGLAADELTGDTKYACEALLCLSSGIRPGEGSPSLGRYFGITRKKWKDTLNARRDFLRLCPVSNDPGMPSLVEAIVNGAGRCDAAYLIRTLARRVQIKVCDESKRYWHSKDYDPCHYEIITVIDDKLPNYCVTYSEHEYTWKIGVKYVGEKMKGGKWVNLQTISGVGHEQ